MNEGGKLGGPDAMMAKVRDQMDELNALLEVAERRRERSALNKRLHVLRELEGWLKTRAGYSGR